MKKISKFSALFLGTLATTMGVTSCNKSDDDGGGMNGECCTFTEVDEGLTYTYTACEDGTITYTDEYGNTETYNWMDYFDNETQNVDWDFVRTYFIANGADCS